MNGSQLDPVNPPKPSRVPKLIELPEDEADAQVGDPMRMQRYECRSCGYVYEPAKGDQLNRIPAGVPFEELPVDWRCPVCRAGKRLFQAVGAKGKPSGFQENLRYGLGVNVMTPAQKNLLIFLGLALGFLFLMSFYFVE
ncbi:rubredoxin [Synechococcus sp. H60.4]|uniref:rubredoxin n=1 Tax=unclassified Synechococcus TaxID=2626047 RepID=UPI0039C1AB88